MELGDRKLRILQAIIKDFITTAEPVGSRTLAKKYDLGISSATIRNEMADLEDLGFLEQPHTSAGRIPSDKGYRLYVDNLMSINSLNKKHKAAIQNSFADKLGELEHSFLQTSKILSQITKLTSVVLSPQFKQSRLKHIQLVPINENNILLVIVSESDVVKNTILKVNESYSFDTLQKISKMLNVKLKGLAIDTITASNIIEELRDEMRNFNNIIERVVPAFMTTLEELVSVHLYLDGLTNIFNLPEYNNINKAREFMSMLDQKDYITHMLIDRKDGVDITIGKENTYQEMKECSLVTATYKFNGRVVGKIGVIGPTRMDYDNIVSVVDFMTKSLTNILKGTVEK